MGGTERPSIASDLYPKISDSFSITSSMLLYVAAFAAIAKKNKQNARIKTRIFRLNMTTSLYVEILV